VGKSAPGADVVMGWVGSAAAEPAKTIISQARTADTIPRSLTEHFTWSRPRPFTNDLARKTP
jgi:hypothetical protein